MNQWEQRQKKSQIKTYYLLLSKEEVRIFIKSFQREKMLGEDGLTSEMLQKDGDKLEKEIYQIVVEVWTNEQ